MLTAKEFWTKLCNQKPNDDHDYFVIDFAQQYGDYVKSQLDQPPIEVVKVDNTEAIKSIKDTVLAEYNKGNIVVASADGLQSMKLLDFINDDIDSMLYDLNRCEVVVLAFSDDPKWINDYAVSRTIRALKLKIDNLQSHLKNLLPCAIPVY